jgi:ATP-dependent Clp protease adapter protein ClpS
VDGTLASAARKWIGSAFPFIAIAFFAFAPALWAFVRGPTSEDRLFVFMFAGFVLVIGYGAPKALREERRATALWAVATTAVMDASLRNHLLATPDHLLGVLIDVPEVASALDARGVRSAELRTALETQLGELARRTPEQTTTTSAELTATVQRAARAAVRQKGPVRDAWRTMLGALVQDLATREGTFAQQLLSRHGLRRGDDFTLDGSAESAAASAGDIPVADVVFWNDKRSTMQGVVEVLTRVFSMSPRRATYLTLIAHRRGKAVVWSCAEREASRLAARCTELAREKNMPLRVTVRSPDSSWLTGWARDK